MIKLFLLLTCIAAQGLHASQASQIAQHKNQTEELSRSNPITSIFQIACLRDCFDDSTWHTMGQSPVFQDLLTREYKPGDTVEVMRGFSLGKKGKIKNSVAVTSQGRVKDAQAMLEALKSAHVTLAFYACVAVPMDIVTELMQQEESQAHEALIQYFTLHPELLDPNKIYVLENSTDLYHVTCLLPPLSPDLEELLQKARRMNQRREPQTTAQENKQYETTTHRT